MASSRDTLPPSDVDGEDADGLVPALVIAAFPEEPRRVAEVALYADPGSASLLGRQGGGAGEGGFVQQRPTGNLLQPPLAVGSLSDLRLQVVPTLLDFRERALRLELLGGTGFEMRVNGEPCTKATLGEGETVLLRARNEGTLLLYCTTRPRRLRPLLFDRRDLQPFGWTDDCGLTGESPRMWRLRDRLAFAAGSLDPVLIYGPSGSGKERAARELCWLSTRARRPFVAKNAAHFVDALADAELFGTARGHPTQGADPKPGLFDEAAGGTLFLDALSELPPRVQAKLHRALDKPGEYSPVGSNRPRPSNVWVIGATSGDPAELGPALAGRFAHVEVVGLEDRREDIPLLVQELALDVLDARPELHERFAFDASHTFEGIRHTYSYARVDPELVDILLRWTYTTHVRELASLVRTAIAESRGSTIEPYPELKAKLAQQVQARLHLEEDAVEPPRDAEELLLQIYDGTRGSKAKAARALGISRQKLDRMLAKLRGRGGGK